MLLYERILMTTLFLAAFSLCASVAFPGCVLLWREKNSGVSSSQHESPVLETSSSPDYLTKVPSPKTITLETGASFNIGI